MPKISELEVKSNGHPTASRSAFLGTEEARGFEELRTYVLAQEKAKKEAERERRLDLGLEAEGDERPGFLKRALRKLSSAGHDKGSSVKDPGHGPAVCHSEPDAEGSGNADEAKPVTSTGNFEGTS